MDQLRSYLASLEPSARAEFARRCGTSLGYIRKRLSVHKQHKKGRFGAELAAAMERESAGAIAAESVCPGFDWGAVRARPAPLDEPEVHA